MRTTPQYAVFEYAPKKLPYCVCVFVLNEGERIATQLKKMKPLSDQVDIIEEKGRFLVRADVPGVNPENIDVSADTGVLSVAGTRDADETGEDGDVRRSERASGRFLRRFTLPETADADGITAKSSNGILEVSIPKLPEIQARRITVEAA